MADFIITIRPEPDASRDVDWLKRYQVPAMAVPVMHAKQQPFSLPDAAFFQAIIFTSRHAVTVLANFCLLYTSPSPRDRQKSRMPSSA